MDRRSGKVVEDDNHIEVLQSVLYALEMRNLDVGKSYAEKRRIGQMDEAVCRWLQQYIGPRRRKINRQARTEMQDLPVRHAAEAEFSERDLSTPFEGRRILDLPKRNVHIELAV